MVNVSFFFILSSLKPSMCWMRGPITQRPTVSFKKMKKGFLFVFFKDDDSIIRCWWGWTRAAPWNCSVNTYSTSAFCVFDLPPIVLPSN
jgi:hypothetical protein